MENKNLYDAIIVGGGPAGLSAAIYLGRARYNTLLLEKEGFGGQITITSEIVNYPGVESASGSSLTDIMRRQAQSFGAELEIAEVKEMELDGDEKILASSDGRKFHALGVIIATGANPRTLGFKGEDKFKGRGVAYCATCDGEFFTGREVLVVGGGFAAVEESMFLTKYAKKVIMLVITENFTCAKGVYEQLEAYPQIEARFETELIEVGGEKTVEYAKIRDNKSGEMYEYRSADGKGIGVFVFAGYEPATQMVKDKIILNEQGYAVTDQDRRTNIEGVYAAGDVCIKNLRQVVTAVADGAIAATAMEHYLSEKHKELGLERREMKSAAKTEADVHIDSAFIDEAMKNQLRDIFGKFKSKVTVRAIVSEDSVSKELEAFVRELEGISENVIVEIDRETLRTGGEKPYIDIRRGNASVGIRYYSVPGGHEFNSFVIALHSASGAEMKLSAATRQRIETLEKSHKLQVMATLNCTNCPEVVIATQKIAALSDKIDAEMYDLSKFPDIKDKYSIMAVPCLIVDDGEKVLFGKKGVEEILEILEG